MIISHVFQVGCGGTGSHLAEPLVRLLSYHERSQDALITFIDGDKFEEHNATRQLFRRQALNRYKAQYLADSLKFINDNITAWVGYVDQHNLSSRLFNLGPDKDAMVLVIAAVDNHMSRRAMLNALTTYKDRNWLFITPGNSLDRGQILSWGWVNGKYVGMNPIDSYPDILTPTDTIPKMHADCMEQSVSTPQLISANSFAALGTLLTVQSLLDTNSFPSEIHFDVRKAKMMPNVLIKI